MERETLPEAAARQVTTMIRIAIVAAILIPVGAGFYGLFT